MDVYIAMSLPCVWNEAEWESRVARITESLSQSILFPPYSPRMSASASATASSRRRGSLLHDHHDDDDDDGDDYDDNARLDDESIVEIGPHEREGGQSYAGVARSRRKARGKRRGKRDLTRTRFRTRPRPKPKPRGRGRGRGRARGRVAPGITRMGESHDESDLAATPIGHHDGVELASSSRHGHGHGHRGISRPVVEFHVEPITDGGGSFEREVEVELEPGAISAATSIARSEPTDCAAHDAGAADVADDMVVAGRERERDGDDCSHGCDGSDSDSRERRRSERGEMVASGRRRHRRRRRVLSESDLLKMETPYLPSDPRFKDDG